MKRERTELTEKKREEVRFFQMVRASCESLSALQESQIVESESPDFLLDLGEKTVGIEFTKLIKSEEIHREYSERKAIVDLARENAEQSRLSPLYVDVQFSEYPKLAKKDRQVLAGSICKIVKDCAPPIGLASSFTNTYRDCDYAPEKIHSIHIFGLQKSSDHSWITGRVGFLNPVQSEINLCIDRKQRKLRKYYDKCDECWLVMVADWSSPATFFDSNQIEELEFEADFEKLIFLDTFSRTVQELRAIPAD